MRRLALMVGLLVLGLAWRAGAQRADMGPPPGGSGGSPTDVTPRPTGPTVPELPWLQPLVDATPEGGTLQLEPRRYSGPVLVTKALTLLGAPGRASIITNGGIGTVFTLAAGHSTLRGLTFAGSGEAHQTDDACLNVRGSDNVVDDNGFTDCLFGIDLKQANRNRITNNYLTSKVADLGVRGDALRLWYSMNNTIDHNVVEDARDVVIWYSDGNRITHNVGRRSRYSLHFMYATHNVVEDNQYFDSSVGIYVMYTEGVELRRNLISHSLGATGMGIGFKEASDTVVEDNDIVYCGIGISSDLSPYQPDSTVTIARNHIAYNGVGLAFIGDKAGTTVEGNLFEGNLEQVAQSGGGGAMHNVWRGNYWDDYQGFDQNHDSVGDTPYELYAFGDRLWMELPGARFFKNAPLFEALDFLERLAPFSTPDLLVRDEAPRFDKPVLEARR